MKKPIYVKEITIATSQLGYSPNSPKQITLIAPENEIEKLPFEIPFFVQTIGSRLKREHQKHQMWKDKYFRWPYEISNDKPFTERENYLSMNEHPLYSGVLVRIESRWGTFWQADLTDFTECGIFQIESEFCFSTPFQINNNAYGRLNYGFLSFLRFQRSGVEMPDFRPVEFADDGVLDSNGFALPAAGGWNDAGDFRKWLCFTLFNLQGLVDIYENGHSSYQSQIIEEARWGNLYFHAMINEKGQVYEDLGGGAERDGTDYTKDWWWENHPGVTATGSVLTDNEPLSGDERTIRGAYNPWVQFAFIRNQCMVSSILTPAERSNCIVLAKRAWDYSQKYPHDNRTLFLAGELNAAMELRHINKNFVSLEKITHLIEELLKRQELENVPVSHFFYEKDKTDGFRSIAFNTDPAVALLNVLILKPEIGASLLETVKLRLLGYIEKYLLLDAQSNPFELTPYGVFLNPEHSEEQTFRDAGGSIGIRTFLHPLNSLQVPHGTSSVVMHQAMLLAKTGVLFNEKRYIHAAEKLMHWILGHNPYGLCLISDMGFKHPVQGSFVNLKIPFAPLAGCIGWFDDSPYQEISNAVEWSTQEIWDVPYIYAVGAVGAIQKYYDLNN
ncbi:MAG: glycoside hydrolase family 9 protein [Prolixibacteraceae bacterium]